MSLKLKYAIPQPVNAHPEAKPAIVAKPELFGNKLRTIAHDSTDPMLNKTEPYTLNFKKFLVNTYLPLVMKKGILQLSK